MSVNVIPLHIDGIHKLLFCDPSASHLAWAIATLNHTSKTCSIEACGMLWTRSSWSRGQRFKYMLLSIASLINGLNPVAGCVTEAFFANPKLMFGSSVIPTVNAFIEMAASERKIGYLEMGPPAWRSILSIKAIKDPKGKRDYKTPTKQYVEKQLGTLPVKVQSNIDLKLRNTPSDIADCLAICLAYCNHVGIDEVVLNKDAFNQLAILHDLGIISLKV